MLANAAPVSAAPVTPADASSTASLTATLSASPIASDCDAGVDPSPDCNAEMAVQRAGAEPVAATPVPFAAMQAELAPALWPLRMAISAACRREESRCVQALLAEYDAQHAADTGAATASMITAFARRLVQAVRTQRGHASGVDALMQEFSLSSDEGVALMCLAEALLRIPDNATADRLIADKLGKGDWRRHLGASPSLFVNAATWGLLITGKLVGTRSEHGLGAALTNLLARGGEPLVRKGVDLAMRMLGNQFVAGQTIGTALANSRSCVLRGYQYSYDMLGEAALTAADAARYHQAYETAIHAIGAAAGGRGIKDGPGISVKLSALHPRYGRGQRQRVLQELLPRLKALTVLARQYAIGINIDAEEADRLELSLDLLEALAHDPDLAGFDGIGFVVQAYQKRCPYVLDYLADLAQRSGRKFMVRLVKGAYWDSEIKRAQIDGLTDYPVYTRKVHTDVSYLVCARKLLAHAGLLYPQFATHNAHTVAAVHTWAARLGVEDYEFQCLHGMGETLYDQVVGVNGVNRVNARCRIYAPVGPHRTLLAYLVRRLLENGANSSFVNRLVDPAVSVDELIADPFVAAREGGGLAHAQIGLPSTLYGDSRINSAGLDLSDEAVLHMLAAELVGIGSHAWQAGPTRLPGGHDKGAFDVAEAGLGVNLTQSPHAPHDVCLVLNPADHGDRVGQVVEADSMEIEMALAAASAACTDWQALGAARRADVLDRASGLIEAARVELIALLIREAGKSLSNAVGEIREAVDFLRFYAAQVRAEAWPDTDIAVETDIATGAGAGFNSASVALGVVACISPWNFPLAIFLGQVGAALATGNVVLAKPAEQTPLVACRAVELLHQAGVPTAVLQVLPGSGAVVGAALVADARVRGVLFTGSTVVAQGINRVLARRGAAEGRELPLIAETGGQNAMIVDSSALPEQVVHDVLASAFDSAGQRCSALRVLCLQEEVADEIMHMLQGALEETRIGNPDRPSVDIGPVIDAAAQARLLAHIEKMQASGMQIFQAAMTSQDRDRLANGTFVLPTIISIPVLSMLNKEVFGPVLHVLRYQRDELPALVEQINEAGYGLTLGIHSRIDETIGMIVAGARVGNIYVNRNIIGAAVGSQPFGGEGLSGTGPKAGGPLYLQRLRRPMRGQVKQLQQPPRPHSVQELQEATQRTNPEAQPALPALPTAPLHGAWRAWLDQNRLYITGSPWIPALHWPSAAARPDTTAGVELPGPTGERNTLSLKPRGVVLCVPASNASLMQQLDAVFMTGNAAALAITDTAFLPQSLPSSIRDQVSVLSQEQIEERRVDAALVDVNRIAASIEELVSREGLLVAIIPTSIETPVSLERLVVERTLTINTSAAGGNARLMTLGM